MKIAALLAASVATVSAFAPAKQAATKTLGATKADLEALAEKANPVVKFYDPMNLAEADFYNWGNERTIGFLRQSEIKVSYVLFCQDGYGSVQKTVLKPFCRFVSPTARTYCYVRLRWIHRPIQLRPPMASNSCRCCPPFC